MLLATLFAPFSFSFAGVTSGGDIVSAVFRNPSGTLDFYYQVTDNANSAQALSRESDSSFASFATDVALRLDGGLLPGGIFVNGLVFPATADRDASGAVVGFNFGSLVLPGITSEVLVISTLATNFNVGNAEVFGQIGGNATVASFAPVPEPASFLLVGGSLLAFAGISCLLRRRRSQQLS
jgi:hypothetical protein